jgi:hypothetical protein
MSNPIEDAPDRSIRNRSALAQSQRASCFFCLRTFPCADVISWTDQGETAICPFCRIDAVLPGEIDLPTLTATNEYCFCRIVRF